MRNVIALIFVAMITAACGGDATTETTDGEPVGAATSTTAPAASNEDSPATTSVPTSTTATEGDDSGDTRDFFTESGAIVTIGDETYEFRLTETGTCDPDYFGTFRAILTRVDDTGAPMENPELPGFTQGIEISVTTGGEGLVGGNLDGVAWTAFREQDEDSGIDSVQIEDDRASGTATFVSEDGDGPVEGTFEVACMDGSSISGGTFCDAVDNAIALDDDLSLNDPDLDQLLPAAVSELDAMREIAPEELRSDVDILYDATVRMNEVIGSYGYDASAVPDQELEGLTSPEIQEAALGLVAHCSEQ